MSSTETYQPVALVLQSGDDA